MHWTCSSFNTLKETRQKPSIHALMGFSLPEIGWCGSFTLQRPRLGFGDGGGDEEGGGLAVQTTGLSSVRLFIYRPIFPLHALTNSLSLQPVTHWHCMAYKHTHTSMHIPSPVHQLVHREDETNQGQKHTRFWDQCCFSLTDVNSNHNLSLWIYFKV